MTEIFLFFSFAFLFGGWNCILLCFCVLKLIRFGCKFRIGLGLMAVYFGLGTVCSLDVNFERLFLIILVKNSGYFECGK